MSLSTLGQGPSSRKNLSSAMGRTLHSMDVVEDKGSNLLLVVTLQMIPWNRKSIKAEKDNGENENVKGKSCHDFIQCLVPDITMLFTPNNWRGGLMGQVPTLGTPFRRNETTIKRE